MTVEWHRVTENLPPEGRDLLVWTGHYMIVSCAHYYDERTRKEYAEMASGITIIPLTEKQKSHYMNCQGRFQEFGSNHYFDNPNVFWTELPRPPDPTLSREEFVSQVHILIEQFDDDRTLADCLEIAPSTLQRWCAGTSCPAPRMRKAIVDEIKRLLEDQ